MKILATPTKDFFISMLTRDISLDRAILDLVDNSVDAAIASGSLENKYVKMYVNKDTFSISDNCGGMDLDTATKYAFRFGRSKDSPPTPNSVGQFGVGMKRTLFKIGNQFEVISRHSTSAFKVNVDVADWLNSEHWEFQLEEIEPRDETYGLEIKVTNLNDGVADKFNLDLFVRNIITEISEAHFKIINSGLKIFVNDELASNYEIEIKHGPELEAASETYTKDDVNVRIIAGIGDRDINYGGWYVICNGRLISFADKTRATGWSQSGIPKFHPDFAYFRGVVDLESADSSKLPWTTTKTGIDVDNRAYRIALSKMTDMMRNILSFLRERAIEMADYNDDKIEITPLNDSIENSVSCSIYSIVGTNEFKRPEIASRIQRPKYIKMQYPVLATKLEIVKTTTGVETNKDAGLLTFDYFFERECEDE